MRLGGSSFSFIVCVRLESGGGRVFIGCVKIFDSAFCRGLV